MYFQGDLKVVMMLDFVSRKYDCSPLFIEHFILERFEYFTNGYGWYIGALTVPRSVNQ